MFRPFILLCAAWVGWPQLDAQIPAPASPPAASTLVSLLQQSHDLIPRVSGNLRFFLLAGQAELIVPYRPDLARDWASELMSPSQNFGPWQLQAQTSALSVMMRVDPNLALQLLDQLNSEELWPRDTIITPQPLVTQVFGEVALRNGLDALPLLQQAAEKLGAKGPYPYGALGYAMLEATQQLWISNRARAFAILESALDAAFIRYKRPNRQFGDDLEFGTMLSVLAGALPLDVVEPALKDFVANVLALDQSKYDLQLLIYTRAGRKVAVTDNPVDVILAYYGGLINRDEELREKLVTQRPSLKEGLEATRDGALQSMAGPMFKSQAPQPPDPQHFQSQMDVMALSHTSLDVALEKANALPVEQRLGLLLDLARDIAGDDPARAAGLIASAQRDAGSPDGQMQLNIVSAQVSIAAARGNQEQLGALLKQGFDLALAASAEPLLSPLLDAPRLGSIVQIGIQNQPDSTLAFLNAYPSASPQKATLLLAAASALISPLHFPASTKAKPPLP